MITEGNEALVHHILLFACWGVDKEHLRNNNKTKGVCNTPEMPEFASSCFNMEYAWAIGGSVSMTVLLLDICYQKSQYYSLLFAGHMFTDLSTFLAVLKKLMIISKPFA